MDKILLNSAIKNGKIYYIDNKDDKSFDQMYYFSINGMIRFVDLRKTKLIHSEDTKYMSEEFFENIVIELEIEYKNLNHFDTDMNIFTHNNCYLVDSEGYHFDIFSLDSEDSINYFVPKVWQKKKLLFLVPDEETEYYFKISHANYKEME